MSEKKGPKADWIKLRKDLYLHTERLVLQRLGEDTVELARYRKEFEKDFDRKWEVSNRESLLEAVNQKASIVLIGDFHALQQSQKAQLRILSQLHNPTDWVLGLECLYSEHQSFVDRFVLGKISEREFLKSVQWKKNWGFPWEHFKPLFLWAIENKVPILALNKKYQNQSYQTLCKRDKHAILIIKQYLAKNPNVKIFAIYGDMHLASGHLALELEHQLGSQMRKKTVRIFQNIEKLYFRVVRGPEVTDLDVVRNGRMDFCLLNVPPWVKWQNYLMYLDATIDHELIEEDGIDYTDQVLKFAEVISAEIDLKFNRDHLSVYTFRDDLFWPKVEAIYSAHELKWIQKLIEAEESFFLAKAHVGYLARASVNHAASLATQFLHYEWSQATEIVAQMPEQFPSLIWRSAITYFGNKIINPKKKTDTISDIKNNLTSRNPKDAGREAFQLALAHKMQELLFLSDRRKSSVSRRIHKPSSYILAARLLGGILGEKLYHGFSTQMISKRTVQSMMKKKFAELQFNLSYYEMLEIIESVPAPFRSKREKL